MKYGLISLITVQLARLFRLVTSVEAVQLSSQPRSRWVLLIRGRRFTRILRDDPLISSTLLRTIDPYRPRPMEFMCRTNAEEYARGVGLMPNQTTWQIRES